MRRKFVGIMCSCQHRQMLHKLVHKTNEDPYYVCTSCGKRKEVRPEHSLSHIEQH